MKYISRNSKVLSKKQKKLRENCFENEDSDLWKKMATLSTKLLLKKRKNYYKKNHSSVYNLCWILGTKLVILVNLWDPIFKTFFPKQFFFSTLKSKISKNMCKLCQKVRNSQNLPQRRPNFKNNFYLSNFMDNLGNFFTNLRPYYQYYFG